MFQYTININGFKAVPSKKQIGNNYIETYKIYKDENLLLEKELGHNSNNFEKIKKLLSNNLEGEELIKDIKLKKNDIINDIDKKNQRIEYLENILKNNGLKY